MPDSDRTNAVEDDDEGKDEEDDGGGGMMEARLKREVKAR